MKLYSMAGTCATSVHMALAWSELEFKVQILQRGEQNRLEYLAINPMGSVPALELDDGSIRSEVVALLLYIDALAPERFGMSAEPGGLARLAQALSFLSSEVHGAFGPHFAPSRFHADEAEHPALKACAYARLQRLFSLMDGRFAGPYYFGESRSVADPFLFVVTRWLKTTPIALSEFPALATFARSMEHDEAVREVLLQYA